MLEVSRRLPNAKVIITTRGTKGSVLLRRPAADEQPSSSGTTAPVALNDLIQQLEQQLTSSSSSSAAAALPPDCRSANGIELWRGAVASSGGVVPLAFSSARDAGAAARRAGAAAQKEAARNADAGNPSDYQMGRQVRVGDDLQWAVGLGWSGLV